MEITVLLDIHAYAKEKLCDRIFDGPSYGIMPSNIIIPLARNKNRSVVFQYTEETTLNDFVEFLKDVIWGKSELRDNSQVVYSILAKERYYIIDGTLNFEYLLGKYFDQNSTGKLTANILVCCDAGAVDEDEKLMYYMHSHEACRHNEPHVHVNDASHTCNAAVRLSDGEVIAGKLPPKLAKRAKERILSKQREFYEFWNTKTDGLDVDIDRHFGSIQY